MIAKFLILFTIIPTTLFADSFTKNIFYSSNAHLALSLDPFSESTIDSDTVTSLNDIEDYLKKETPNFFLILDSHGGSFDHGKLKDGLFILSSAIVNLGNLHQLKFNRPMNIYILKYCNSMCTVLVPYLRAYLKMYDILTVNLKIATKADFGFHGASSAQIFNSMGNDELLATYSSIGIDSDWLQKRRSLFITTDLTYISAEILVTDRSQFVLKDELFNYKSNCHPNPPYRDLSNHSICSSAEIY